MAAQGECVACGEKCGYDENHHCDPKRLEKIENARKASTEHRKVRERQFGERLSGGEELNGFLEK